MSKYTIEFIVFWANKLNHIYLFVVYMSIKSYQVLPSRPKFQTLTPPLTWHFLCASPLLFSFPLSHTIRNFFLHSEAFSFGHVFALSSEAQARLNYILSWLLLALTEHKRSWQNKNCFRPTLALAQTKIRQQKAKVFAQSLMTKLRAS